MLVGFTHQAQVPFVQGTRTGVRVMNALWFYGQRAGRNISDLPAPTGRREDCTGEHIEFSTGLPEELQGVLARLRTGD